jgi:transcription elongation factor Elf1
MNREQRSTIRVRRDSQVAECPECGHLTKLSARAKIGLRLTCTVCGERLEVIGRKPLEVDYALNRVRWGQEVA